LNRLNKLKLTKISSKSFYIEIMLKYIFSFFLMAALWACDNDSSKSKEKTSKKSTNQTPYLATNRSITSAEKPLVGKWSTAFRDVKGNLVTPKQTEGSFLEIKNNGSYQLLLRGKKIREGAWKYDPEEKSLELKTKINTSYFTIDAIQADQLEMTDQKRGFKLTYLRYKE
jgi:hypothetical protein